MYFNIIIATPVAVKKHMNFMGSPEGLTPILKQPGSVKRGKQRRVTINNLVLEQSYQTGRVSLLILCFLLKEIHKGIVDVTETCLLSFYRRAAETFS